VSYRIDTPPQATHIKFDSTNPAGLRFYLEQGTFARTDQAHWQSYWQSDLNFDQSLANTTNNWPWLPGYTYYLTVTNVATTAGDLVLN
jgi:hypothetical protein